MDGPFDLRHVSFEGCEVPPPARCIAVVPACPEVRREQAPGLPPDAADDFGRWLLAESGLDPGIYRVSSLRRRVAAALRALHAGSVDAARTAILADRSALPVAVHALLIGVTDFFRDTAVADALRGAVIPALSRRAGPLRIWSAGCSSGPELYSIAMLLDEAGLLERTSLLGTDCRPEAISAARSGLYRASETESLPAGMRARYLEEAHGDWRITERVRRRVEWRVADFWTHVEAGPWDVIAWRNVAIYLNPDASERVLSRLIGELAPGGFLVVGKAERVRPAMGVAAVSRCIYRKPGGNDVTG